MHVPIRALHISPSDVGRMERNLWRDGYVPASLKTNGQTTSVKVRYRGGHTRGYPKRSYEVVRQGQTFHYNAEFDDPSMIRNALSFWFIERLGLPAPRTKHVQLQLNGEPLGTYLEIEAVDRVFFRKRGIAAVSLFYAVNEEADFREPAKSSPLYGYEHRFGGNGEKSRLIAFIRGLHSRSNLSASAYAASRIDVNNYLTWLAGAVLTGNYDGFDQNFSLYRHRSSGKWRMVPWDYEGTWGRNCFGKLVSSELVSVAGYNHLTRKLLYNRSYVNQYKAILQRALHNRFTESCILPQAERMHRAIAPYYREDRRRQFPYELFLGELDVIRNYIAERRMIVARELARL